MFIKSFSRFLKFILVSLVLVGVTKASEYSSDLHSFLQANSDDAISSIISQSMPQMPTPISNNKKSNMIGELRQDYSLDDKWPSIGTHILGAVSSVKLDFNKNIVIFHRGDHVWNAASFDPQTNIYTQKNIGPIAVPTILTLDRTSGEIIHGWGENLFHLPHGLTIDGNLYYITDVALHQVMRFDISISTTKANLVLGKAFKPGSSSSLFCKPTSVVAMPHGDFFVADGYCNSRIIKYDFYGTRLYEWGKSSFSGINFPVTPEGYFAVPHALTLAKLKDEDLLCVADRENGRVQCFFPLNCTFHSQYHSPIVGDRMFSVDYAAGKLFVVNGPEVSKAHAVGGFAIDMNSGTVVEKFGSFSNPHDLAVSSDASEIYVAEIGPNKIHKFILSGLKPTVTDDNLLATLPKAPRGNTAFLAVSLIVLFAIVAFGIVILIAKRRVSQSPQDEDLEYHRLMTK